MKTKPFGFELGVPSEESWLAGNEKEVFRQAYLFALEDFVKAYEDQVVNKGQEVDIFLQYMNDHIEYLVSLWWPENG